MNWKRRAFNLARILFAAFLVAIIVRLVDPGRLAELLTNISPLWLGIAACTFCATQLLQCLRWKCSFSVTVAPPYLHLLLSYLTSHSVGTVLPSEYGGDVLRVADASKSAGLPESMHSVFLSRMAGLTAAMAYMAVFAFFVEPAMATAWIANAVVASLGILALLAVLLFSRTLYKLGAGIFDYSWWPGLVRKAVLGLLEQFHIATLDRKRILTVLALSVLAQGVMNFTNVCYATSLGIKVTYESMAVLSGLVALASLLPLSPGGIGVKEGIFVLYFQALGLGTEDALATALLNRCMLLALALLGAALFPLRPRFLKTASSPAKTVAVMQRQEP